MGKRRAQQEAQTAIDILGDGWTAVISENIGWHWHVRKGNVTVWGSKFHNRTMEYRAMIHEDTESMGGLIFGPMVNQPNLPGQSCPIAAVRLKLADARQKELDRPHAAAIDDASKILATWGF